MNMNKTMTWQHETTGVEAGFEVAECGITGDVREGRGDEKWVNVIAKKQ